MNESEQLLAQIPLFAQLPHDDLHHLALTLQTCEFTGGEILFRENEQGDFFYIVRQGQVEVVKALETSEERLLAVRGPGEFIGEMSLLNRDGLRTASVRAASHVKLWVMTRHDFDALLNRYPVLAYEMVRVLSSRLRAAHNIAIRDMQEKNLQLTRAYEQLKAAQDQLIEKEKLERELQVAHDIQMSILPDTLPRLSGYDFGACLVPARSVGGDFFDFLPLNGDRLGIMIGDVTDKGVPAAIFMAQVHAYLRAEAERNLSPTDVLHHVNRHLMHMNEHGLFVTVLYGVLSRTTREFTYARAGHELPILRLPNQDAALGYKSTGQPLGLFHEPLLDEQVILLPAGATLLLYTDGITDERDPQGDNFGMQRLLSEIGKTVGLAAQEVCDRLLQVVMRHLNGAAQDDDITLVSICADRAAV